MKRVLVVDDDADILSTITMVLEAEGYLCTSASTGHKALKDQAENPHDLLILDYRLPEMSGADILTALRERGDNTPILFLSADRDFMSSISLRPNVGALGKPFDIPEFLRVVERLCSPGKR